MMRQCFGFYNPYSLYSQLKADLVVVDGHIQGKKQVEHITWEGKYLDINVVDLKREKIEILTI